MSDREYVCGRFARVPDLGVGAGAASFTAQSTTSAASHIADGPWIVGPFGEIWMANDIERVGAKWRETRPEPRIVASPSTLLPKDEVADVARLIAAAPDLLAALQAMVENGMRADPQTVLDTSWMSRMTQHQLNAAVAAVAKAKGDVAGRELASNERPEGTNNHPPESMK